MKKILIFALAIFNIAASLPWMKDVEDGGDIDIVDGHDIDITKVPYQVSVLIYNLQTCAGAIINKNFILTAAHGIQLDTKYSIRAGSNYWSKGGVHVNVTNITIHPKYAIVDFDIALLQLEKPLEFTDKIRPAKLADKSYVVPNGDIMLVAGWGSTGSDPDPGKLLGVELPQLNFNKCTELMKKFFNITLTRNYLCALHPDGGHNICHGDSGVPLTHKGTLVGVTSYGGPCNHLAAPVAYTSVAVFRDWIESIAGKPLYL